jgi:hypothetical protein
MRAMLLRFVEPDFCIFATADGKSLETHISSVLFGLVPGAFVM